MKKIIILIISILALIILASEPELLTFKNIILKIISVIWFWVISLKLNEKEK